MWRGTCKTFKRPLVKQVWSPGEWSGLKARMGRPGCECPGIQITREKKGLATDSETMPTGKEPEEEAFLPPQGKSRTGQMYRKKIRRVCISEVKGEEWGRTSGQQHHMMLRGHIGTEMKRGLGLAEDTVCSEAQSVG